MDRVALNVLGEALADGALRRLRRVGRTHHIAVVEHRPLPFQNLDDDRPARHVGDEVSEEGAFAVNSVERLRLLFGQTQAALGDDPQPRLLQHRVDRTGEVALGRVRLDDGERSFHGRGLVLSLLVSAFP